MPTALFSLSDKVGLFDFARGLVDLGWDLLASGGTAAALRQTGLPVQEVVDYTGSPEILAGRVKTLHPAIHGGILARSIDEDAADLNRIHARVIDLVAVNLYPFEQTVARPGVRLEQAVENIDIGGVALIRAAAKNFARVVILTDAQDYRLVLEELRQSGTTSLETRQRLAAKAFSHTAAYDTAIRAYFDQLAGGAVTAPIRLQFYPIQKLRYGENPHQEATLLSEDPQAGPFGGQVLQGKALSYTNILDLDAAWHTSLSFERPTVCIVKHSSPCGIACGESLADAYPLALASDPVSAFGGVIAVNRLFDEAAAACLGELFLEGIIAPGFTQEAMNILARRKNLRLVALPETRLQPSYELRSVMGGMLRQSRDLGDPDGSEWNVVTSRSPEPEEWKAIRFAWKACQHVKSNAIVFARGEATVGIGGGQPNRVDCVRIAAQRAGDKARRAVMASDAFFPFPDSVEEAVKVGITAIVQPGGSQRDAESIAVAQANGVAMVFTGIRHFRH